MGSVIVAPRLESTGSIVVAHGLSCSTPSGIFPDQGSNPCLLPWQADSLPLIHKGTPKLYTLNGWIVWYMNYISIKLLNKAFLMAQMVKSLPVMQETPVQSLGWEDPLEKGMPIHSNILAWRIPRTEEPGGLPVTVHGVTKSQPWLSDQHFHSCLKKNSKFYKCSYLGALSPLTGYFPPPSPGSHLQVAVTLSESQVPSQVQLGFSGCSQMSPNHIIHNLRRGGSPRGKALSLNLFWVQIFPFYIFCVFFWTHCSECWILVPWLGIKPMPPAVEAQS